MRAFVPLGVPAAVLGLAVVGMAAPAAADPGTASHVVTTVDVRPATVRIGDDQHGYLIFVNKSRADLCTPERIAYEQAFLAWLDGGEQGDPPPEPASSQQGAKEVQFTQRTAPAATTFAIEGPDLPVEVWKQEDDPDGLDCTATDGPGAALFATGAMTWRSLRVATDASFQANDSIEGQVVGTDAQAYHYLVRYLISQRDGGEPSVRSVIQLVPTS
jgi:hypothetical protein